MLALDRQRLNANKSTFVHTIEAILRKWSKSVSIENCVFLGAFLRRVFFRFLFSYSKLPFFGENYIFQKVFPFLMKLSDKLSRRANLQKSKKLKKISDNLERNMVLNQNAFPLKVTRRGCLEVWRKVSLDFERKWRIATF